jgi:hypothetical protein
MKAIVWSQFSDTEKIQLLGELVDDSDDAIRGVVAEWLERLQPAEMDRSGRF